MGISIRFTETAITEACFTRETSAEPGLWRTQSGPWIKALFSSCPPAPSPSSSPLPTPKWIAELWGALIGRACWNSRDSWRILQCLVLHQLVKEGMSPDFWLRLQSGMSGKEWNPVGTGRFSRGIWRKGRRAFMNGGANGGLVKRDRTNWVLWVQSDEGTGYSRQWVPSRPPTDPGDFLLVLSLTRRWDGGIWFGKRKFPLYSNGEPIRLNFAQQEPSHPALAILRCLTFLIMIIVTFFFLTYWVPGSLAVKSRCYSS